MRYRYKIGQHLFLFFRYIFDIEHDQIQTKFNENEVKKAAILSESTVIFNRFFSYASCARRSNL